MNILLIDPPWIKASMNDRNLWKSLGSCLPSLGLAYIAAVLREGGHTVRILDCTAEQVLVSDVKDHVKSIMDKDNIKFDMVGLTATTPLIKNAWAIAEILKKEYNVKIVLGGVHATVMPDESLALPYVDYVVRDEGEMIFLDLADGMLPHEILGLSYKSNGQIIHNELRPLIPDLDKIPIPAYDLLPLDKYHPSIGNYKRLPAMSMFATRGCVGRCTYCHRAFRGCIRKRSAAKIIEEIKTLRYKYGFKEISFYDDTFTALKPVIMEMCNIIIKEKIDVTWSCFSRVDCVTEDLMRNMKKAGCHLILFGVESADEKILDNIHKRIKLETVKETIRLAKKVGLETRTSFMFGNPGETIETMQKSLDFAIELDPDEVQFNITTVFPGTEMYKWADEQGYILTKDWDMYNMSNIVWEMPDLPHAKIQEFYHKAHKAFYLRPKVILRRLLKIRTMTQLMQEVKGGLAVIGL